MYLVGLSSAMSNTVSGGVETRTTSFASFTSTPCAEAHQEPSTLLRKEVAAMYVRCHQQQAFILNLS